eukprot:406157_1
MTKQFYQESNSVFAKKSVTDLLNWIQSCVLPLTIALLLIHYIGCKYIFTIIADKVVISSKYQGLLRRKRITLVSTHVYKFLCYVYIVSLGINAMYDLEWVPSEFLFVMHNNSGHVTMNWLIWQHDRFAHINLPIAVQKYFEFVTAYNLHSFIWHLTFSYGFYNFYEMLLHHFVTLSLISFCFITGHTGIGVLVTIIHDITDIPAYAIKLAVNTSSDILSVSVFAVLLFSWCYYRVYAFGYGVIYPLYLQEYKTRVLDGKGFHEMTVYVILLSTLCALHLFWIYLFLKIFIRYAKKGVVHDSQETKRSEYSDTDTESD